MEIISGHENADFDCLGAMVGASLLYPEARMVFPGGQERGLREFFRKGGGDRFRFHRLKDLDLSVLKRVVLVDVRQASRIGALAQAIEATGAELHLFDHHPGDMADLKGDLEHIEPVGSTVTVVAHELMRRGIEPDAETSTLMMLGLYEDTGNLLFSSTTVSDLEAAAFLLGRGADLNRVADYLTQELSPEQVALLHELIENRILLDVSGVGVAVTHASVDNFIGDLASLVHKLKDIENLNAVLAAVRMGERIFMVGRSRIPEVHMGRILEEFGGGGHAFAASATVRELTLVQILERIPVLLKKHVSPCWLASDLMSKPVRSLDEATALLDVRTFLTRYNINAAPVLSQGELAGIISRQSVERALHHGLGSEPVSTYMQREFVTAAPDTKVEDLQELTLQYRQRFLPVVEGGRLVGVVTRTDLLRYLLTRVRSGGASGAPPAFGVDAFGSARKNVQRLMNELLPTWLLRLLKSLSETADSLGVQVYAVGGFVRDLMLRQANLDVDLVVEGDGIAYAQAVAQQMGCRVREHRKFGTAVLILEDGFKVDVASARMEYYLEPGALPMVESAPIKLDLYRRDFTINTLAIALNGEHRGRLIDFFNAQRDLKDKAIRVLHNLSFVEDPTRMFRAVRFEKRLGFHVGRHTEHLVHSAVRMGVLERVAGARVYNELNHIFSMADPWPAMERLDAFGLLRAIHPSLGISDATRELFQRAAQTMGWFELLYTGEGFHRPRILLLCLTWRLDQDAMRGACARLDLPGRLRGLFIEERARMHCVQLWLQSHGPSYAVSPVELCRHLDGVSVDGLLYLMARIESPHLRQLLSQYFVRYRHVRVEISGSDLLELGIPPGPLFKKIFIELREARLEGLTRSREDELAFVRKRYL